MTTHKILDRFAAQIQGDTAGPKLVFLHGLMGSGANWRRITPYFVSSFEILTYDQRGHGRSFQPSSGYAPEDFAQDLVAILDELNWNSIFLVGHSMGGRAATHFSYRHPERVRALVIEDIGPNRDLQSIEKIQRLLDRVPTPFSSGLESKSFFMNDFGDPVLGAYLNTNIEEKPNGQWDWRFSKTAILEAVTLGRSVDRWDEVEKLRVPTLVVRGETSQDLPRSVFDKMVQCNPLIKGVEIGGAGHWVHFDRPQEFAQRVLEFFETF